MPLKWCEMMMQPCWNGEDLVRQEYWQGQLLGSGDLLSQIKNEDQLRWWHNRAIHHAYGIVEGYEVRPEKLGEAVTVTAGLAYDSFGRPLRLCSEAVVHIPANYRKPDCKLVLVVGALGEQRCGENNSSTANVCLGETSNRGVAPLGVKLQWKASREFNIRDGVVIAVVATNKDCDLNINQNDCLYRICSRRVPYLLNGEAQTTPFYVPFPAFVTDASDSRFTFRVAISLKWRRLLGREVAQAQVDDLAIAWLQKLVAVKWIGFEPAIEG
jgi:hypothetical protein